MMTKTMPDEQEQRKLLIAIRDGGGYGLLFIVHGLGDVLFAVSPVPNLAGFEICCASPDRLYDVWKDGNITKPDQTREQVREWIRTNTPDWLCDDSKPTDFQKALIEEWVREFTQRYLGQIVVA
jgi:hypothetical protein